MLPYHLKNFPGLQQKLVIPEAQNTIAFLIKPCIALPVIFFVFRCSVLAAIKLNNDFSFKAYKIDDIFPYRMLTPELEAVKTLGPQMRPQGPLGICRRGPKFFSISNKSFSHLSAALSQPSPQKGEGPEQPPPLLPLSCPFAQGSGYFNLDNYLRTFLILCVSVRSVAYCCFSIYCTTSRCTGMEGCAFHFRTYLKIELL